MDREEIICMAQEAGFGNLLPTEIAGATLLPATWVGADQEKLTRFAELVAAKEREAIMDEWHMCVQSDLENGVKWMNERAALEWAERYPQMAGFAAAVEKRGATDGNVKA